MPDENDETPIERRRRLARERKSRWLARQSQATLDRMREENRQRRQSQRAEIRASQQIELDRIREENRQRLQSQLAEIRASQQIENEAIQIDHGPDQRALAVSETEGDIESHSCGSLESICQYCQALHFPSERLSRGNFNSCCHKGKVKLPARQTFPLFLKDIMSNPNSPDYRNFHENIRCYNSAISFASMGAKLAANVPGRGPYCFRVQGQIYHVTSHLHPQEGEQRKFAQLYVLNTTQAVQERLNIPQNEKCLHHILRQLDLMMQEINPFAQAYKMLYEIERQSHEQAARDNLPVPNVHMFMRRDRHSDQRRYNLPTANEVAMVFQNEDGEPPFERDIRIYPRTPEHSTNNFVPLNILSPNLDPMTYAIFYPHGEAGWQPNLVLERYPGSSEGLRKNVSMLQYKVAQTAIRRGEFNPILYGGPLTQQWVIDSYLQVEANNLNFVRQQQSKLRCEEYAGLVDYVCQAAANANLPAGRAIILPSSFQGSPRNMRERYHDAMAIVTKFGKPDIFCTFTCNPKWPEILNNLPDGQTSSDRPDLVARVFHIKLHALLNDITKGELFGKCLAYVYTIEFQKRGLPHAHILLILAQEFKFHDASQIDRVIVAELSVHHPRLHEIVSRAMIHGPCGTLNPKSPCMENGNCSKNFPKTFQPETRVNVDGYPFYQRREDNSVIINGIPVDNRWVVPYNPTLLLKYDSHINIEACTSIKSVKYIYKYIYKGYDSANVVIHENNNQHEFLHDEISNHVNARYVSAPEAMWRLLEFKMHDKSHSIIRLAIHLPHQQMVYFQQGMENAVLNQNRDTTLTAWFKLNISDVNARQYLYAEIPLHYVFEKGVWKPRQRGGKKKLARMFSVSPKDIERYCLRLLLLKIPGATSFEDLRTFEGVILPTFLDAARQRQLLADDQEWDRCLSEACVFQMPAQLRQVFAFICLFCNPSNPLELWEKFNDCLCEDFRMNFNDFMAQQHALHSIQAIFRSHGVTLSTFNLPTPSPLDYQDPVSVYNHISEASDATEKIASLNLQQKEAFTKIIQAIDDEQITPRCFYLDGPGGSGKTYVYNTLLAFIRGRGEIVLPYATTGIAAILLKGGRTVHSGFKLPVPILETSTSSMRVTSDEAVTIRQAKIIIIDEATMMTVHALRCIDALLRELMGNENPFGNKVMLLGGDFRQTLPVVTRGTKTHVIEVCIKSSPLWEHFLHLKLSQNMRSEGQNEFNQWLLDIGEGKTLSVQNLPCDIIQIPSNMLCTGSIVAELYGNEIDTNYIQELSSKIILTTTNKDAMKLNNEVMNLLPGAASEFYSADSFESDLSEGETNFSQEFLNEQTPSGMPPHKLILKVGAIVMLLRNMNPKNGLCNGTRLIIRGLYRHFLDCEILTGANKNDRVFIPRIDLTPSDTNLPFKLIRRQFPIIIAFAMTINKSQGQTFNSVGLHLEEPVFSHGQLYVGLSRCKEQSKIKVSIRNTNLQGQLLSDSRVFTKNIVFPEILF